MTDVVWALLGGALIGLSASIMLLFHGRITGITGIVTGLIQAPSQREGPWRALFIGGLLLGGALLAWLAPATLASSLDLSAGTLVLAGLLVGFGGRWGSGCTSGHGVCGISRLSPRSIVATLTFMTTGMLTVYVVRLLGGAV